MNEVTPFRSRLITHAAAGLATTVVVTATVVAVAPGGADSVRVVETGFSPATDPERGHEDVAWGAVVENTTDQVAYETELVAEVLDDSGDLIEEEVVVVDVLLPGQRLGIGPRDGLRETGAADEVRIRVEETASWADPDPDLAPHVVSDVSVTYTRHNQPLVQFTVDGEPSPEDDYVYAIFRNRQGDIIGGARSRVPPGIGARFTGHVAPRAVLDGIETVEVYAGLSDGG